MKPFYIGMGVCEALGIDGRDRWFVLIARAPSTCGSPLRNTRLSSPVRLPAFPPFLPVTRVTTKRMWMHGMLCGCMVLNMLCARLLAAVLPSEYGWTGEWQVPMRLQHLAVEKLMLIARRLKPSAYAAAAAATAPRAAARCGTPTGYRLR